MASHIHNFMTIRYFQNDNHKGNKNWPTLYTISKKTLQPPEFQPRNFKIKNGDRIRIFLAIRELGSSYFHFVSERKQCQKCDKASYARAILRAIMERNGTSVSLLGAYMARIDILPASVSDGHNERGGYDRAALWSETPAKLCTST